METMDDSETLAILNLHPGEEYELTVTAINEEGESERSTPLTVRTLERGNAHLFSVANLVIALKVLV